LFIFRFKGGGPLSVDIHNKRYFIISNPHGKYKHKIRRQALDRRKIADIIEVTLTWKQE